MAKKKKTLKTKPVSPPVMETQPAAQTHIPVKDNAGSRYFSARENLERNFYILAEAAAPGYADQIVSEILSGIDTLIEAGIDLRRPQPKQTGAKDHA